MALHRDIYWVGRQWAVTGFGVQAVDQRLQGAFDIEAARVWDDDLQTHTCSHAWVNGEDLAKALRLARERFPGPARKPLALVESVLQLISQPAAAPSTQPVAPPADKVALQPAQMALGMKPLHVVPPPAFELRTQGPLARFLPQWRVKR